MQLTKSRASNERISHRLGLLELKLERLQLATEMMQFRWRVSNEGWTNEMVLNDEFNGSHEFARINGNGGQQIIVLDEPSSSFKDSRENEMQQDEEVSSSTR